MGNFLKKDFLVMIRDKSELITLLLMPFILIGILGFALKGLLGGDISGLHMPVAIVQEDDEQVGIEKFVEELRELGLPKEEVASLNMIATEISPIPIFEQVFANEEIKEIIELLEMDALDAEEALANDEVAAILVIPEDFSYESLRKVMLNEGEGSSLEIRANDTGAFYVTLFSDIVEGFVRNFNYETALASSVEGRVPLEDSIVYDLGGVETISKKEPISSFQYYTIGMAVMFVLMTAGAIASKAFVEMRQHVFDRILLSGYPPSAYLTGKIISATLLAFCQLMILFLLSSIIFGAFKLNDLQFWLGILLISFVLAACVGCLAAVLTTLTIRFNNDAIGAIFSGGVVALFAFAGGSFFPTEQMPEAVLAIGKWTPNGAAFQAYLQWIQSYELSNLVDPFIRVIIFSAILLIASLFIFPKRRSV